MQFRVLSSVFVMVSVLVLSGPGQGADLPRYIVTLKKGVSEDPGALAKRHAVKPRSRRVRLQGMTRTTNFEHVYRHALRGFAASLTPEQKAALERDPRVLAVEPDGQVVPFQSAGGPKLQTVSEQVVPTGVKRMGMDRFPRSKNLESINVAILDTGIDLHHPDLNVSPERAISFVGLDGNDTVGHGTLVAGVIGALDNGFGVVGVAPGVKLWSLQVIGPDGGAASDLIAGIDYIAEHSSDFDVVNASLGGYASDIPLVSIQAAVAAVVEKGIVFVSAAGNTREDLLGGDHKYGTEDDIYPAALPESLTVSGMDDQDGIPGGDFHWYYSNNSRFPFPSGLIKVNSPGLLIDVAAPGVNILSTFPCEQDAEGHFLPRYATDTGTSMSAPHVAGLVAAYMAHRGRGNTAQSVYDLRQEIINRALPQSEWNPDHADTKDPDRNFKEGLAMPFLGWVPVTEEEPKVMISPSRGNNGFEVSYPSVSGWRHILEVSDSLSSDSTWNPIDTFVGDGQPHVFSDPYLIGNSRFYRVRSEKVQ